MPGRAGDGDFPEGIYGAWVDRGKRQKTSPRDTPARQGSRRAGGPSIGALCLVAAFGVGRPAAPGLLFREVRTPSVSPTGYLSTGQRSPAEAVWSQAPHLPEGLLANASVR